MIKCPIISMSILQRLQRRDNFKLNFIKIIIFRNFSMQHLILHPMDFRFKSNFKWDFKSSSPVKFIYIISFSLHFITKIIPLFCSLISIFYISLDPFFYFCKTRLGALVYMAESFVLLVSYYISGYIQLLLFAVLHS